MTAWLFVLVAGVLEIGWAISLKMTEGFTRYTPMIGYAACGLGAAFCLSRGMKLGIPMAVAYAAWQGVALVGTTVYDTTVARESFSLLRVGGIVLILSGIAALKMSMPDRDATNPGTEAIKQTMPAPTSVPTEKPQSP